ncbi:uncharacterized protein LOC132599450 [Lycium barbarum]|uniref:uncharacterized protein LOC132599450 n=1 Tax=Lycium barbarum TaxID=112863 RepID=UPI00293EEFCF|nr:uncharacterized protein LOC132599450 [Lycium barbarum]
MILHLQIIVAEIGESYVWVFEEHPLMADGTTPNRVTRASADKMAAERRSKNIHDPRRVQNPPIAKSSKKIDSATVTKRRKTTDIVPGSKGKQVVEAEAEEEQLPAKKQVFL